MSELEREDIHRRILESLLTGVCLVDRSHKILFWNEGAEKATGHLRQDVLGRDVREVIHSGTDENDKDPSQTRDFLVEVLRDGKPAFADMMLRHRAGHLVPARIRVVAIRNDHGTIIGAAESFDENPSASDWDRRQETLAGYGALDSSTGVLTENFLLSHLRENLRTFKDCQVPFSVVAVRVDKLDEVKARYGPGVVAVMLRSVGQTLENSLRPTDFLGRSGEADFLSILTECSRFDVGSVCERLKNGVHGIKVSWWGDRVPVTASLGATTVLPEDEVESLLARVARSMEASVGAGGNLITVVGE
ncbi:MAG TPA: diguanylate cyclase [Candidatus Acidoferrales bacterium]|nr:diguanylate cyclase [Candidatus Acidoferrales bacterium]